MKNPAGLAGSSSRACGAAAADKGASTEAAGGARSKAWGSCWVVIDFLIVGVFFFSFPGVSVTSSNTGVPDISGSVYNKTQVSNAGPSSLMA